MTMLDAADFDAVANAEPKGTKAEKNFFQAGVGRVVIEEIILKKAKETNLLTFVVQAEVVSVKPVLDPVTRENAAPNKVGDTVSMIIQPHKFDATYPKMAASLFADISAFVHALLGASPAETKAKPGSLQSALAQLADIDPKTQKNIRKSLGAACQPARGMLVDFRADPKLVTKGKNLGQRRVYPKFTHVLPADGNTKDAIAQRRADLDKRKPLRELKEE